MEWKTIDSAPKDGTPILTVVKGYIPSIVEWVNYNDKGMFCIAPETFMEEEHFQDYFNGTYYDPTHWMPLPESPKMKNLNDYRDECHTASTEAGWWLDYDKHTIPAKMCLIHSEISEAMEGYRKCLPDDHLPHRPMVEVELADAMIRIFDLAGKLNCDLEGAYNEKREYNKNRADHKPENRAKTNGKTF